MVIDKAAGRHLLVAALLPSVFGLAVARVGASLQVEKLDQNPDI
jgi:hypothetical protein